MGNNHSLGHERAPVHTNLPVKSSAEIRAEIFLPEISKRRETVSDTDANPPPAQHRPVIRRTSSQRGYHPRSASLRRMRSIQRRRILEGAQLKSKPLAKMSAKMEVQNKKLQEQKTLLAASARGDLKKVEQLVDFGVDVNSSDRSQMSALHYAAMHAREEVIKSLIARGAEVNATDLKGGFTALHWVVMNAAPRTTSAVNHVEESLTALVRAGCKVNSTDFNSATPLHIAAQRGNRDAVQVLLKLGAQPDKVDIAGRNCYEVAKTEQLRKYMRDLVDRKNHHTYHVLEVPPPSGPAPLPPVAIPPPRLLFAGRTSSQEEPIYSVPYSPPESPTRLSSETPPPPPPRRRCHHPKCSIDSSIYYVLEPIPVQKTVSKRSASPPRKRKSHRHVHH